MGKSIDRLDKSRGGHQAGHGAEAQARKWNPLLELPFVWPELCLWPPVCPQSCTSGRHQRDWVWTNMYGPHANQHSKDFHMDKVDFSTQAQNPQPWRKKTKTKQLGKKQQV